MSSVSQPPSSENQITNVLKNLLTTQYALDSEDQERVQRLVRYAAELKGLTKEEKQLLINRGLMDGQDGKLTPPSEFIYRGIITPAFWFKCLLAMDELIDFSSDTK